MELFSEIYSCYYRVLRHLLCSQNSINIQQIYNEIYKEGFEESLLSIIPKLEDGTWNLFEKSGDLYISKINSAFTTPLSNLQKAYLKALISDSRIRLFLDKEQLETINNMLLSISPLWKQEQFYYYDKFNDGDPFENEHYQRCFRTLLNAQKNNLYVDIEYNSPKGTRIHHYYYPARLEYSVKNDKFRIIALEHKKHHKIKLEILNIDRIQEIKLTDKIFTSSSDLNTIIKNSYYKEPITLHIINKRNALERAMLHFANYEKNTTKIDENTYECLIYYNKNMETELLIEVMSFGPMLTVLGNDRFLNSLKQRLKNQLTISSTN